MKFLFKYRRFTNFIGKLFDNFVPPILRDSLLFNYVFRIIYGKNSPIYDFKKKIIHLNDSDIYKAYHEMSQKISRPTDLTEKCISEIMLEIEGSKILDVGTGNGYLLKRMGSKYDLTAVEPYFEIKSKIDSNYCITTDRIDALSFNDATFDTVICTHVLEHALNFELAISELRRVCKNKLIIVVPMQRPYRVTPDLHLHFFPSMEFFLIRVRPKSKFEIKIINGDIFYIEYQT